MCPAAKNVPPVILMIAVTVPIAPVDFSLIEPVDVVPSLQVVVAVPAVVIRVPFGEGLTSPPHVACIGGVPVASVLRLLTVTVPPVMVVPEPLQPVIVLVLEMVCCVGVLVIPGEKVDVPDPPVHVSNVDAKAGAVPARMRPAPLRAVTATATVKRFNLNAVTPVSKRRTFSSSVDCS